MHNKKLPLLLLVILSLTGCTKSKYDYKVYEEMVTYLTKCDESGLSNYIGGQFVINGNYKKDDNGSDSYSLTVTLTEPSINFYDFKIIIGSMSFTESSSYEYASTGFNKQSPVIFSKDNTLGSNVTNLVTLSWITTDTNFSAKAYVAYNNENGERQNIQFKFTNFVEKV